MNFKSFAVGASVATTAMAATIIGTAPAQAASLADNPLTGTLAINLDGLVTSIEANFIDLDTPNTVAAPGTTNLNASRFSASTGSFFSTITGGTIKDLPIFGSFPAGGITDFIVLTGPTGIVRFNLLSLLSQNLISNPSGPQGVYQALVQGIFLPTGQPNDASSDIFQFRLTSITNTGSAELTPIPTPALLPGLLALGAGVLRKRKSEVEESSEA